MPYCPDCGAEVATAQSFCADCGVRLNEPTGDGTRSQESGSGEMEAGPAVGSNHAVGDAPTTSETELGIDENVAGALAYLLGIVSGLFFYLTESESGFVRFHAAQSIAFSVGVVVLYMVLSTVQGILASLFLSRPGFVVLIPAVMVLIAFLVWIGVLVLWLLLMVKAFNEETYELPVVGQIVAKYG